MALAPREGVPLATWRLLRIRAVGAAFDDRFDALQHLHRRVFAFLDPRWAEAAESFEAMGLDPELLRGVSEYGFREPSWIQQRAVVPLLRGLDLVAQAPSGTGKTAACAVAALQRLSGGGGGGGLWLAPTRELACPIHAFCRALGNYVHVKSYACLGGEQERDDIENLALHQQLVVGTPGRVQRMVEMGHLRLADCLVLLLDEADELLGRGFRDQVLAIAQALPAAAQVALLAARLPKDVLDLAATVTKDPVHVVRAQLPALSLEAVRQFYVAVEREEWKRDTLQDVLEASQPHRAVVYCNTRRKAEWLAPQLVPPAAVLNGDLDATERERTLQSFRTGAHCLVSTDLCSSLAAEASLVLNYDLPASEETYLLRVGSRRDRRMAISLVLQSDVRTLRDIEQHHHTQVEELPMDFADLL